MWFGGIAVFREVDGPDWTSEQDRSSEIFNPTSRGILLETAEMTCQERVSGL
jgi:hypothetical protein